MIDATTQTPSTGPTEREDIGTLRENLRTFRIAAWLGWQIEGNWADPLVFFIFTVLRPMASALIIVIMYNVVAGGQRNDFFEYLYISNAFFVLVVQVMAGLSWTIIDDRENYKMLKYIYTSPARKFAYLIGRAVAKVVIGLLTTLLLLATGVFFLGLRLDPARIEWGWLAIYFAIGMLILAGFGIMLAGISLVIARNGGFIGEVVAGMLLLFSGAYFPPDILPPVLREVSLVMPTTYWLEGMRRALSGGVLTVGGTNGQPAVPISPTLSVPDNVQLAWVLVGCAIISAVGSFFFYRWVEHAAKERGMIDRLTGF
jgi:ABC-2 type transport system permease protein